MTLLFVWANINRTPSSINPTPSSINRTPFCSQVIDFKRKKSPIYILYLKHKSKAKKAKKSSFKLAS